MERNLTAVGGNQGTARFFYESGVSIINLWCEVKKRVKPDKEGKEIITITPFYNPEKGSKRKRKQEDPEKFKFEYPPFGKKFTVKANYALPTRKIPLSFQTRVGGMNVVSVEWVEATLCDLIGYLAARCTWGTFKQLFRGNKLLVESCRYASIMYIDKKVQFFGKRKAENTTAFLSSVKSNISTEEMLSLGAESDIASLIKSIGILRGRIGDRNKKTNAALAALRKNLNSKVEIGIQKSVTAEQQAAFRFLGDTENESEDCSQVADRLFYREARDDQARGS